MLEGDDRKRAGQVVGSLLDRQNQLGAADDPFTLMRQLTETFQQPTGLNSTNTQPGLLTANNSVNRNKSSNPLGMNMSSYAAFQKQVISQTAFAGTLDGVSTSLGGGLNSLRASARRRDDNESSHSPNDKLTSFANKKLACLGPLPDFNIGGVSIKQIVMKDASSIVKNKEIFEKAQRREKEKSMDWFKLQQSKTALLDAQKGKLPLLSMAEFSSERFAMQYSDPTGAFDRMISSKKEAKDNMPAKKLNQSKIKLSKEQEVQIGLEMIPMYQAKEEELTAKHKKLKVLRQEIEGYMEEQGTRKVRYAQPQHVTHFMNRKVPQPNKKKQTELDVTDTDQQYNADLTFCDESAEDLLNASPDAAQNEAQEKEQSQNLEPTPSPRKKPSDYESLYKEFEKRAEEGTLQPPRVPSPESLTKEGKKSVRKSTVNNGCPPRFEQQPLTIKINARWNSKGQQYQQGNQTQLKPIKSNSVASHRSSSNRANNPSQDQPLSQTNARALSMNNQSKFLETQTIKSNNQLKNISEITSQSGSTNLKKIKVNKRRDNSTAIADTCKTTASGILEVRGESTCSSKEIVAKTKVNSDGEDSALYPELSTTSKMSQTRKSCHIIETFSTKKAKLEGADKLTMPPVQTAVSKHRRKKNDHDISGVSSAKKIPQNLHAVQHICESQKRIKAIILDKRNNPEHLLNESDIDAAAAATATNQNAKLSMMTHREQKSFDDTKKSSQNVDTNAKKYSKKVRKPKESATNNPIHQIQCPGTSKDRERSKNRCGKSRQSKTANVSNEMLYSPHHQQNCAQRVKASECLYKNSCYMPDQNSKSKTTNTGQPERPLFHQVKKSIVLLSSKKAQKRQQISHSNVSVLANKVNSNKNNSSMQGSKYTIVKQEQLSGNRSPLSQRPKSSRSKETSKFKRRSMKQDQNEDDSSQLADKVSQLKESRPDDDQQKKSKEPVKKIKQSFKVKHQSNKSKAAAEYEDDDDEKEEIPEDDAAQGDRVILPSRASKKRRNTKYQLDNELSDSIKAALENQLQIDDRSTSLRIQRSNSVASNQMKYNSFTQDTDTRINLHNAKIVTRNANSSTFNEDKSMGRSSQTRQQSRLNQRRQTAEQKVNRDLASSRNVKELIFVDQKAFDNQNIAQPEKKSSQGYRTQNVKPPSREKSASMGLNCKYNGQLVLSKDYSARLKSSISSVEVVSGQEEEYQEKNKKDHSLSLTQSMALQHIPFEKLNSSTKGSKQLSRVHSTEQEMPESKIQKLQQNLAKLEKLERRLMRGQRKYKKQQKATENSEPRLENTAKSKDDRKKGRKKQKNWRFAYDLYCKEIINSNGLANDTQRSQEKLSDQLGASQQLLMNKAPRYAVSNSIAKRQHVLRQIAANKDNNTTGVEVYNMSGPGMMLNINTGKDSTIVSMSKNSSRKNSQQSAVRRISHTAADQAGNRSTRVRNGRILHNSRINTAACGVEHQIPSHNSDIFGHDLCNHLNIQAIQMTEANEHTVGSLVSPKSNFETVLPNLNNANAYPIAPEQPKLSERSQVRHKTSSHLPFTLKHSPERDEIILFGPMQTSQFKKQNQVHPSNMSNEYRPSAPVSSIDANLGSSSQQNMQMNQIPNQFNRFNKRVSNLRASEKNMNSSPGIRQLMIDDATSGDYINTSCISKGSRRRDLALCEISSRVSLDHKFAHNLLSNTVDGRFQNVSPPSVPTKPSRTNKQQLVASI